MANIYSLDISKYNKVSKRSEEALEKGIRRGLTAIKNDWVADAVDLAPVATGNLQSQINGQVDDVSVIVKGNARHDEKGDVFNYGYYIHEVRGNKFLDDAFDETKAQETLEREVEKALRKVGW